MLVIVILIFALPSLQKNDLNQEGSNSSNDVALLEVENVATVSEVYFETGFNVLIIVAFIQVLNCQGFAQTWKNLQILEKRICVTGVFIYEFFVTLIAVL